MAARLMAPRPPAPAGLWQRVQVLADRFWNGSDASTG
jgi:hypothetical protein